jgi:hypothetical protein
MVPRFEDAAGRLSFLPAKILASLAWRSRFGARPLPRQPEPQTSPSGVNAL